MNVESTARRVVSRRTRLPPRGCWGCEGITLSYAGYELPDGTTGWDAARADEQELKDSMTVVLQPGEEEVLAVDVRSEAPGGNNLASIGLPVGVGLRPPVGSNESALSSCAEQRILSVSKPPAKEAPTH